MMSPDKTYVLCGKVICMLYLVRHSVGLRDSSFENIMSGTSINLSSFLKETGCAVQYYYNATRYITNNSLGITSGSNLSGIKLFIMTYLRFQQSS